MEGTISRAEHEEFVKRIEEENKRQNRRIDLLEENVLQIGNLTTTIAKLAVSVENITQTQTQHGKRLEDLESRDGEKWRTAAGYTVTVVVGIVIGYLFKQIGM